MLKHCGKLVLGCAFLSLAGCQTTSNNSGQSTAQHQEIDQLIISEPLTVNFKKEVALARISDFLVNGEISQEQRAKAYYDRGLLYDSFGLANLARLDFNRALRVDPKLAAAYNFLGIHYTLAGQFNKAYEAFDTTLELEPDHEYVYLNRGISLYYGGKNKLAVEDLTKFHQLDQTDPYRVIWRYLTEHKIDKQRALDNLKQNRENIPDSMWAKQVADLYLMNISEATFVNNLTKNIKSQTELAERLCEAYFYLGIYARMYDQPDRALNYFKLSLATNVFEFVEHKYARRELLETRLEMHKNKMSQKP
ncbi:lipoprotein NlpI [Psychrobium sp. 1_MG-2023]|uniref:lipoprotein NlpI n=1 Tax=Psychrobium sp. 1_MG-2023 TaxID=3062624 RepID=UPI000C31F3FF|nr:lipoprotein NlpI [Psychrobium sp. 1_MG-2023]MDP2562461.1 lipoprotein NlpI [Psychrobium sp. 1_MG-2023]PKF54295.1 lipoprotein NlpI [Alteromonadales bacterium alter-6D02]